MRSRAEWMWRDGGGARHTSDGASPRATARGTRSRKWRSATACIRGCCSGGGGIARRRARARVSSRWWSRRPSRRARRRPGAWRSCWARTCGWWSSPAAAARISALIVPAFCFPISLVPPGYGAAWVCPGRDRCAQNAGAVVSDCAPQRGFRLRHFAAVLSLVFGARHSRGCYCGAYRAHPGGRPARSGLDDPLDRVGGGTQALRRLLHEPRPVAL